MKKAMHKLFSDFTKEELWLSKMSENGYALTSAGCLGKHIFEKTQPQKYNYRIDYRVFKSTGDFEDYRTLFSDSGWLHIWGTKNSGRQYFVQTRENALDDVFSDSASKAGRYKRLYTMWFSLMAVWFTFFVAIFSMNQKNLMAVADPKALYHTPGLWEMSGARFWLAFLFETPFAFGRGFLWILYFVVFIFCLAAFLKAFIQYSRQMRGSN